MAFRKFASDTVSRLGLRVSATPSFFAGSEAAFGLRALGARAYASVAPGFKYAKSHEYVNVEGDTATIGISDFAQSELGDVVYVELPEVGSEVKKGETFGVVESVKAASDVYSPVSGEVVAANADLSSDPSKVNAEPFKGGWMIKVKLADSGELDALLDSGAYEKQCEESH